MCGKFDVTVNGWPINAAVCHACDDLQVFTLSKRMNYNVAWCNSNIFMNFFNKPMFRRFSCGVPPTTALSPITSRAAYDV